MTGTCQLCRALVIAPPVLVLGPERTQAEYLAFADACSAHVHACHKDHLQVFTGLLVMTAGFFATLFMELPAGLDDFEAERARVRDMIAASIVGAKVVIQRDAPGGKQAGALVSV